MGAFSEQDLRNLGFNIVNGRAVRHNGSGRPLVDPPAHERTSGNTRPPKYHNKPCYVGHERFDSKKEAELWLALGVKQQAGEIADLKRQVRFDLHAPVGRGSVLAPVGYYVADFTWREGHCPSCSAKVGPENPTKCAGCLKDIPLHIADAKGGRATQTQIFAWKVKHLAIEYGVNVEIL